MGFSLCVGKDSPLKQLSRHTHTHTHSYYRGKIQIKDVTGKRYILNKPREERSWAEFRKVAKLSFQLSSPHGAMEGSFPSQPGGEMIHT